MAWNYPHRLDISLLHLHYRHLTYAFLDEEEGVRCPSRSTDTQDFGARCGDLFSWIAALPLPAVRFRDHADSRCIAAYRRRLRHLCFALPEDDLAYSSRRYDHDTHRILVVDDARPGAGYRARQFGAIDQSRCLARCHLDERTPVEPRLGPGRFAEHSCRRSLPGCWVF